ncbi:hypothetical protein [Pseudooceanicola spongiae]|uniref:Uncharacterized protein n=1 Tax=Pseudooceanicola spongiae TaxID=2613965 RepID=A0A7L9WKY5_9RHOB|nr:hypothetical protein [Pseudooceanicola spongiae]QOL80208.1 hypothetical protein F3W81_04845 [Pseudooceanicola spongiae]
MIEPAQNMSGGDPSDPVDISAADLATVLAGQVSGLQGMTAGLEEALSASLCSCNPLTEAAFVTFQRIDYMRQSLKDIEGLLLEFGPNLGWLDKSIITKEAFSRSVDMADSISPMLKREVGAPVDEPSSQAGDLDLW